jgi:hypothetical protein
MHSTAIHIIANRRNIGIGGERGVAFSLAIADFHKRAESYIYGKKNM